MRPLAVLAALSFFGATCVTVMANRPAPPPRAISAPHARSFEADRSPPAEMPPAVAPAPRRALPPRYDHHAESVDEAIFANTYYDFPADPGDVTDTPIYTARCEKIADVSRSFHDRLCVQGSGRLASGATVSFAERGCACAELCPRTGQRICFEALDPARFAHGRGATGRPITPLRTVAVDPSVIPMGASLFIPEYVGLPRPDGSPHDGCFVAEDRGLKITGRRIDVFAGDPHTRLLWDAAVPSNRGVHVFVGAARCGGDAGRHRRGLRAKASVSNP